MGGKNLPLSVTVENTNTYYQ